MLAKLCYSKTGKLGRKEEEGAAAMRANQSTTRSRGAGAMVPEMREPGKDEQEARVILREARSAGALG